MFSSGVPQGSNLGPPLLFNIYINDLLSLDCNTLTYADDLKIYSTISSFSDSLSLQRNIGVINDWCCTNKIHLNINKYAVLAFTRSSNAQIFHYNVSSTNVQVLTFLGTFEFYLIPSSRFLHILMP
ncbi:hypothetical protein AMK59_1111 [Oryctes borbonicus]|uniref:Reverse transcriptase domain-containing protein n=1 Tax=Oryctes borbonicus TaxID=1629725 RepID=A0A0T6BHV4_9SCAR|nr:hypothetical protein AMK59_1111 [Oryctes borbonicus]